MSELRNLAPAWADELETAGRLARQAGELVLEYRDGDLQIEHKPGDEGPVTIADRAASALIVAELTARFPSDIVISEENADDSRRRSAQRVWYIDPIDGTKDFIRREDGFCVMIGLAIGQRPAVGAVYQPVSRRLFVAAPEAGAWMLASDAPHPVRIFCSTVNDLKQVRLVASKSHRTSSMDTVKGALGIDNERNIGSIGLKLALIAVGECDAYVNPSAKTSSWDTCGPEALLHEAGGKLTDLDGNPLRYDQSHTNHTRGLLATNSNVHADAVSKLSPLFPSFG